MSSEFLRLGGASVGQRTRRPIPDATSLAWEGRNDALGAREAPQRGVLPALRLARMRGVGREEALSGEDYGEFAWLDDATARESGSSAS
jgi:hypothetical protein